VYGGIESVASSRSNATRPCPQQCPTGS
jgi:hypothetical protein